MNKIKSLFTASLCLFSFSSSSFAVDGPNQVMGAGNITSVNSANNTTSDTNKLVALRTQYKARMIRIGVGRYWHERDGRVNDFTEMDRVYDLAVSQGRKILASFRWNPNGANSLGNYQKWYDIGRAYARRYPRVIHWTAMNEPDGWKTNAPNYPSMAAYENALEGLADGVRSVRASTAVSNAGIKANFTANNLTGGGFIPAIKDILNDGTLRGIDCHIYKTDDNGTAKGALPNRYDRSAQRLFEGHKSQSGVTADCEFYCTETGNRFLNTNNQIINNPNAAQERELAKRYFTMLWDTLGVTKDNGRTRASEIAFGWDLFGDAPAVHYRTVTSLSPFTPKSRAIAFQNLARWTQGTNWVRLDPEGSGVYVLENPGVRKVWVKQNLPGWTNNLSPSFTCTNTSAYRTIKVMRWDGRVRTVQINGASSVRVTGLNTGETYLFLAQP